MNCRSCHFVDEFVDSSGWRYAYLHRLRSSAVQFHLARMENSRRRAILLRWSMPHSIDQVETLFHFDGEFSTLEDLIVGTFTGRNFGWLPGQKAEAIRHIARVMREDDGNGAIAQQFDGLSYSVLFTGANPDIPDELRLPPEFRVFIGSASDQEVFDAVVKVVAAYVNGLRFSQTDDSRQSYSLTVRRVLESQRPPATAEPVAKLHSTTAAVS